MSLLVAQIFVISLFIYYFLVVILYVCCYSITNRSPHWVEAPPDSGKNKIPDSGKNKIPLFLYCFLLEQPLQVLLSLQGRDSRDFSM